MVYDDNSQIETKGVCIMAQQEKLQDLKTKLSEFITRIELLDPEETSVEDIDRLISMLEELEHRMD